MKKNNKLNWILGLFLVVGWILTPVLVNADIKDILLRFQPYISAQEEYSTNIDLEPKNKKDDFITTISPGIRFSTLERSPVTGETKKPSPTEIGVYGIDLDYRANFVYYSKETDNNYVGHHGTLNAWYTPIPRLIFRLSEYLTRSEDPLEQEYPGASPVYISGTFVDLTNLNLVGTNRNRSIYLRNVVTPSIEYMLPRSGSVALIYTDNYYRNQDPLRENSRQDTITGRVLYWLNIRHGLTLEYGVDYGNFGRSADFTGQSARGRYTYRFSPKTSVFGEHIFRLVNFEDPGIDYHVNAPSIGIEHTFSRTLTGLAQVGYFWQTPRRGKEESDPTYSIVLSQRSQRVTYGLMAQGGYREDFGTSENQGFSLYHRVVGSVSYRLNPQVTAGLSASYEWIKSGFGQSGVLTDVSQREHLWSVSSNMGYQILRWLKGHVNLTYRENRSNVDLQEYNEFRGLLRFEAVYF